MLLLILLAGGLLGACSAAATDAAALAAPSPTATATLTSVPTATPTATSTALPTATATVAPTFTPTAKPIPTPMPTATLAPTPLPTGDRTPARLVIPAINLDRKLYPVGLDKHNVPIVLDHDVGWYLYSAKPGQGENIVLWGHVLRFRKAPHIPAPFADVERLAIGSEIFLYSADGTVFRYVVARKERVTPDQVQYILPTGDERLTLVSCIGDRVIVEGNVELTHRLVTIAMPAP
ncbi:class F sortase [uncultured Chloroflexus sp.]|uniref:sortase n=1 Tax=uncultured Chloroflexus sp. TaxID=214040 RepID=UPI00261A4D2D|nr:class F sortase [uncultured Chloroflexus sp.]